MYFREISASLYPWDLADEGVGRCLDILQNRAGITSVYLVALMHYEKRPLTDFYYPHNPVRKVYFPEDSRVYWKPNLSVYEGSPIQPLTSERDFLKDKDWMEVLARSAQERGLKLGAEISHTVLDKERAEGRYQEYVQKDYWGRPLGQALCFNHPGARAYLLALFKDLASHYPLNFIQTCLIPWHSGYLPRGVPHEAGRVLGTLLGGCFCSACGASAQKMGIDWERLKERLREEVFLAEGTEPQAFHRLSLLLASNTSVIALLLGNPEVYQWLQFRRITLTQFFKDLQEMLQRVRPGIDLRLNAYITSYPELSGLDFKALSPHISSIRSSDYSEQSGDPSRMEQKRRWLLSLRWSIGEGKYLLSAIGIRPKATPDLIRQGVRISAECGADGLSLGHYDGAPLSHLDAVREGLLEAEVELCP